MSESVSRWPEGSRGTVVSVDAHGVEDAWPVEDLDVAVAQARREYLDWGRDAWVEAQVPGLGVRVIEGEADLARLAIEVAALGLMEVA